MRDEPSSLETLERQNRARNERIKRLIKTESRLYRTQRQVDEQLKRINTLNVFALEASKTTDPTQILSQAAHALLELFPFEQVAGFACDREERIRPVVARSVPGREAPAVEWPAELRPCDEERTALRQPVLVRRVRARHRRPRCAASSTAAKRSFAATSRRASGSRQCWGCGGRAGRCSASWWRAASYSGRSSP